MHFGHRLPPAKPAGKQDSVNVKAIHQITIQVTGLPVDPITVRWLHQVTPDSYQLTPSQ
jgi:hypothetical protein